MNIYIPYSAARDIHRGLELKYALRSIEKYLTGWREIYVIGDLPKFLNPVKIISRTDLAEISTTPHGIGFGGQNIEYTCLTCIPGNDIEGQKETSIYRKMLWAGDKNFIMWHDDHYLLKPMHVSGIKQWHNGTIAQETKRPHGARYGKALHNTLERFPEGIYADIHTPIVLSRDNLSKLNWDKEYCLKSLYCNIFPGEQEFMEDLKFDNYVSKEYIKTLIKDRLFFSTGSMYDPMIEVLEELFPNKSKFEL